MRITWLGGATTLFEIGPLRILFDPVFRDTFSLGEGDVTRARSMPEADLSGVSFVALTSARTDHYDADTAARVGADVPVLVPSGARECLQACGHSDVREVAWLEAERFEGDGFVLTVTAVAARSGNGDDNGYFLSFEDGGRKQTAYITGDALFTDDVRVAQRSLGYANLLVPYIGAEKSPGGKPGSADADEAMQFVYRMQPNAIVPVHHGTFSHYTEGTEPFADALSRTIYDRRLHMIAEGQSYER